MAMLSLREPLPEHREYSLLMRSFSFLNLWKISFIFLSFVFGSGSKCSSSSENCSERKGSSGGAHALLL